MILAFSAYDAAVDGLLKAAREYCERPDLRKYAFSTIAFRKMDDAACAVARKEGRRNNIVQILHLEYLRSILTVIQVDHIRMLNTVLPNSCCWHKCFPN